MMKKLFRKKWFLATVGVVIIGSIATIYLSQSDTDRTMVQADLVKVEDIAEIVTASGRIQPQTKVNISAEVTAEIMKLYIKEGDLVEKDQSLLLLDTIQLKSDLIQTQYNLDEMLARQAGSRAQHEKEKLEFKRQGGLYKKQLISENIYNNAKYTLENALSQYLAMTAQVKTSRSRVSKAENNLSKTLITAPMSGVVTFLRAEVGEIAQGQTAYTQGKTLMTVSDLSIFEVEVDVDETEVARVMIGQKSEIKVDAFRDTTFVGEVVEIGNSAKVIGEGSENYSTNFLVKVRFVEAHPGIRPGMSASVDITTDHASQAVLIPYASIVTREFDPDSVIIWGIRPDTNAGQVEESLLAYAESNDEAEEIKKSKKKKIKLSGAFVIDNGLAKFIEVETGIADDRNIVALTGITVSDTVISGSYQTLRKISVGDAVEIDQFSIDKMEEDK